MKFYPSNFFQVWKPCRITQADRLLNTPASLVDNTRTTHSPYPFPLSAQNNNSVQHQLVFPRSTCHQNALQCRLALLRRPGSEAGYYSQTRERRKN
ncbi:hypothetical protein E2C01_066173 [Portunus trituberculatus]|uniref:Uncharacterized protein n=1 Tax=Portunus trituberculatus TaxID=210409 RepID=A0A5B7HP25_PORTR|nr:hypothetical protein [Portunus trituberculatus]